MQSYRARAVPERACAAARETVLLALSCKAPGTWLWPRPNRPAMHCGRRAAAPGARTVAAWDFCPPRTCFCQACLTRAHRKSSGVETRVIEPYAAAQLVVKHAATQGDRLDPSRRPDDFANCSQIIELAAAPGAAELRCLYAAPPGAQDFLHHTPGRRRCGRSPPPRSGRRGISALLPEDTSRCPAPRAPPPRRPDAGLPW